MPKPTLRESDLYEPVKRLLEAQGYEVKGEVGAADMVAVRGDEDPVVVELKCGFSLALLHQAVERQRITDAVYVAVPRGQGRAFAAALKKNKALCRRLGLGLITVRLKDGVRGRPTWIPHPTRRADRRGARSACSGSLRNWWVIPTPADRRADRW